jgi:hypothetical protein
MLPMKAIRLELGTLLAADVATLAPVAANKIALIMAPFSLNENLAITDLTLATFATSTPIAGAAGAQAVGVDPATLDQVITIKVPAGGYRWVVTALTNLPQTIYGWALIDTAGATLIAVGQFPTPYLLQDVGQEIDLGNVTIQFVQQPMS